MSPSRIFLTILLAFLAGVLVAPHFSSFNIANLFLVSVILVFLLLQCHTKPKLFIAILALIALICGIIRYELALPYFKPTDIAYFNDSETSLEMVGKISSVPDTRPDKTNYTVAVEQINLPDITRKVHGKILVSTYKYPEYNYGDQIRLKGKLLTPIEFDSFSYKNYLARYNIHSVIYRPSLDVLKNKQGNWLLAKIFSLKTWFENRLNRLYPEPHASFMAGLLVGSRRGIPEQLMEDFNTTGLTHIIAISGYNITLIIIIISGLLKKLPRKWQIIIAITTIVLFTILVGASAAVIRASIMGILGLLAISSNRKSDVTVSIVFTAFLMILWNPKILHFDVGFQLSFLATLGLVYVSPYLEKVTGFLPRTLEIRESVTMTLSAQVTAVPIIVYHFARLSLIAPVANLFVLPAIPPAMFIGFCSVIGSLFVPILGIVLSWIGWLILEYIIIVTALCAQIPFASLDIGWVNKVIVALYYAGLIIFIHYQETLKTKNLLPG